MYHRENVGAKREAGDAGEVVNLNGVNRKDVSEKMPFKQRPERSEGRNEMAVKR